MSIILMLCLVLSLSPSVFAQNSIDSPGPGSVQSGAVAPPNGWICNGGEITAAIDGGPTINFIERQNRGDTAGACGNNGDNAFVIAQPWNWNVVGEGQHTIRFFNDGLQFASVTFEIATFGTEIIIGPATSFTVPNFPDPGGDVVVSWDNAIQNFRITEVIEDGPPPTGPSALLGTWRFTFTLGTTTLTDEFTLDTLTDTTPLLATGQNESGHAVVGGLIQDINPGNLLPYDFAVLSQGFMVCTLHVFDLTSSTTARGDTVLATLSNGFCGSIFNVADTIGVRTQAPKRALSAADGEAKERAKILLAGKSEPLSREAEQAIMSLTAALQALR